ncbi:serine/arginine-rich splicing factor 4-like [Dermacentor silvarum]|uniref:serine/arginine-rich splicing factor 4-like n=1 Tax=Dermacentor silvarum TaxID=543639 RepID=UPI001897C5BD|nr:serine/arginine-rich splicing factor 4-like [Dermacentor silvarum]
MKNSTNAERREAAERRALNALLQPTDSASSPADKAHNKDYDDEDEKDYRDHSEKKEKSRRHPSRTRRRPASRGHSSRRSRDRSASFPPLEEMKKAGSNQSGGRSGNSKTSNSHDNKKSEKTSRSRSSSSSSRKADKQSATMEHIFWNCPADPTPEELQKLVGFQKVGHPAGQL